MKMNKMKIFHENNKSFFKTKKVVIFFAVISFLGGFLFLKHNITGNAVISGKYFFSLISLSGLLLILCSIILGIYALIKER